MVGSLWNKRRLIGQLARREVSARYRGSFLGWLWAVITPLFMLAVYTFVFSVVFQARWGTQSESRVDFALALFAGLLCFNVFGDVVQRAPALVINNSSYVKRVVFPLEILSVVTLYAALIPAGISLVILLAGWGAVHHTVSATIWLFPLMLAPICTLALGLSWIFSALGVFIRDVAHPVAIGVQVLLFVSGIFFPLEQLPHGLARALIWIDPLVTLIDNCRRTLIWGQYPDWKWWAAETLVSLVVLQLGFWWFAKSRKAFADVL